MNAEHPPSPLTPREIQSVAKARRILERWDLADYTVDEALAHLRAMYGLRRHGLRDYIRDSLGVLAGLPVSRFELYADTRGETPLPLPDADDLPLADYLAANFDQRTLPGYIHLVRGRDGDERDFYL